MSRFKTDYLALPETVAAANEAAKAAIDALEQQSLPPPPTVAPAKQGNAGTSKHSTLHHATEADDFLGDALGAGGEQHKTGSQQGDGGGALAVPQEGVEPRPTPREGGAEAAHQAPADGQHALQEVPVVEDERPIDIFKAIFEDASEDEEVDREKERGDQGEAPSATAAEDPQTTRASGMETTTQAAAGHDNHAAAKEELSMAERGNVRQRDDVGREVDEGVGGGAALQPPTSAAIKPRAAVEPSAAPSAQPGAVPDAAAQRQKLLDALELLRRANKDGKKKKRKKSKKKKSSSSKKASKKASKKRRAESSSSGGDGSSSDD